MPPNNHERNTVCVDSCYETQYQTKKAFPTNYNGKLTDSKMAAHVAYSPFNHQKDMAVLKDISPQVNYDRIEKMQKESDENDKPSSYYNEKRSISDENDKPSSYYNEKRSISDENARNQELFDIMKYEVNRLNSFTGKWPLCYIKPKDLAQNGFFYLQSEDKVQCAFCHFIIDDWNVGDKPVKKHLMANPKCEFLLNANTGNVQITKPKPVVRNVNKSIQNSNIRNTPSHKPKYPWMSDMKNRLLSYRDWPLLMLSSRQLAECGLFYTGVGDTVTCFYCGGSLHQWELNDNPWEEHEKAYPDCGFLDLVKTRVKPTPTTVVNHVSVKSSSASARPSVVSDDSIPNEVIRQAGEIFPDSLVQKVAVQHFQKTGKHFTSLHDICDAILQYKAQEQSVLRNIMSPSKDSPNSISGDVTSNKVPVLSDGFQVHVENNSISPLLDAGSEIPRPIFKCDKDGLSPNPRSCASFIKCSHHLKYVLICPEGLHFNKETGQCEKPCDAQCDQSLACECGWPTCVPKCEEPNGIYAHPDECEKFIKCDNGKATVFECSGGKAFDVNRKKCAPKREVSCKIDSENELPAIHL